MFSLSNPLSSLFGGKKEETATPPKGEDLKDDMSPESDQNSNSPVVIEGALNGAALEGNRPSSTTVELDANSHHQFDSLDLEGSQPQELNDRQLHNYKVSQGHSLHLERSPLTNGKPLEEGFVDHHVNLEASTEPTPHQTYANMEGVGAGAADGFNLQLNGQDYEYQNRVPFHASPALRSKELEEESEKKLAGRETPNGTIGELVVPHSSMGLEPSVVVTSKSQEHANVDLKREVAFPLGQASLKLPGRGSSVKEYQPAQEQLEVHQEEQIDWAAIVRSKESENEALRSHLSRVERENAKLRREKAELQEEVKQLRALPQVPGGAKAAEAEFASRYSSLEVRCEQLEEECRRLRNENETLIEQLREQTSEPQYASIGGTLGSSVRFEEDFATLKRRYEALEITNRMLERRCTEIEERLAESEGRRLVLEESAHRPASHTYDSGVASLSMRTERTERDRASPNSMQVESGVREWPTEARREQLEQLIALLERRRGELETDCLELEAERRRIEGSIGIRRDKLDGAAEVAKTSRVLLLDHRPVHFEVKPSLHREGPQTMEELLNEYEKLQEDLSEVRLNYLNMGTREAELQKKYQEASDEIAKLRPDYELLQCKYIELQEKYGLTPKLHKGVGDSGMSTDLEEEQGAQIAQMKAEIEASQEEMTRVRKVSEERQTQAVRFKKDADQHRVMLARVRTDAEDLRSKLTLLQKENDSQRFVIQELKGTADKQNQVIEKVSAEAQAERLHLTRAQVEIEHERSETAVLRNEAQHQRDTLAEVKVRYEQQRALYDKLHEDQSSYREQLAKIQVVLEQERAQAAKLHSECERQHSSIALLQRDLDGQKEQLSETRTEKERLQKELAEMREEAEEVRATTTQLQIEIEKKSAQLSELQREAERRESELQELCERARQERDEVKQSLAASLKSLKKSEKRERKTAEELAIKERALGEQQNNFTLKLAELEDALQAAKIKMQQEERRASEEQRRLQLAYSETQHQLEASRGELARSAELVHELERIREQSERVNRTLEQELEQARTLATKLDQRVARQESELQQIIKLEMLHSAPSSGGRAPELSSTSTTPYADLVLTQVQLRAESDRKKERQRAEERARDREETQRRIEELEKEWQARLQGERRERTEERERAKQMEEEREKEHANLLQSAQLRKSEQIEALLASIEKSLVSTKERAEVAVLVAKLREKIGSLERSYLSEQKKHAISKEQYKRLMHENEDLHQELLELPKRAIETYGANLALEQKPQGDTITEMIAMSNARAQQQIRIQEYLNSTPAATFLASDPQTVTLLMNGFRGSVPVGLSYPVPLALPLAHGATMPNPNPNLYPNSSVSYSVESTPQVHHRGHRGHKAKHVAPEHDLDTLSARSGISGQRAQGQMAPGNYQAPGMSTVTMMSGFPMGWNTIEDERKTTRDRLEKTMEREAKEAMDRIRDKRLREEARTREEIGPTPSNDIEFS